MTYTICMNFFVASTPASQPKTKNVQIVSIGLAAVFVAMAVVQLFTFESFPDVLAAVGLPIDSVNVWAAIIVTLEVFAVPFLLAMRLSPAMRIVSMISGWLVVLVWLGISIRTTVSSGGGASGLLGATITIPAGVWSVFFCAALAVVAVWATWGNWPVATSHKN